MTDIAKFFEAFSWRAYKENDLSDVTYAMCEADSVFKQFFLNFFFKGQELNAGECTIEREVSYVGYSSRPDIVIRDRKKGVYFVEVKIWDGNHHFAQYAEVLQKVENISNEFVKDHFGYITAYSLSAESLHDDDKDWFKTLKESSRVRTWKDLCERLEGYNYFNDEKIAAYVRYCRNLCAVDDLYPSLLRLYSEKEIKDILFSLEEVAKSDCNILTAIKENAISEYNQAKYFNPTRWMGHHFSFSSKGDNDNHDVWAWIGVWLGKWGDACCRPCIILRDREGWGKIACDKLRDENVKVEGEDGKVFLPLKLAAWQNPKDTLEKFIGWVRGADATTLTGIILDENNDKKSVDSAKMFYLIPMFIRNELTGTFDSSDEKYKYQVAYHYGNDAQQPQSWCGEYLSAKKVDVKGGPSEKTPAWEKTCYIGFYFGDTKPGKSHGLYFEVDGSSEKIELVNLNNLKGMLGRCLDWAWSDKAKLLKKYIETEQRGAV